MDSKREAAHDLGGARGSMKDDLKLLSGLEENRTEAWERLYRYLREEIFPRIAQRIPPGVDAQDILSDAMIALRPALRGLREAGKLRAYVMRTVVRLLARRQRERERWKRLTLLEETRCSPVAERNLRSQEFLQAVIASLKKRDITLFRLLYIEGIDGGEACSRLGVSAHVFSLRKSRLRKKLRVIVGRLQKEGY